jgi:hypothetical protein
VKAINSEWGDNKISKIFDGGLYGYFCRNKSYKRFVMLYFTSLCVLGLYAYFVWLLDQSYLGIIGLISNFIYDIFIYTFSALGTKERSIFNIFALIFIGRTLSFVFGS